MAASEAAVEGISGAVGAMIACVATYPLMTISTKQAVLRNGVLTKDDSKTRRGTLSEITSILRNQGLQGLYHGIQPALIGTGVSQGVYFYLYGLLRKFAVDRRQGNGLTGTAAQDIGITTSLLVASLAGCGNVMLTNPFWVLVTRMQTSRKLPGNDSNMGPCNVAKEIFNEEGVFGFWKGVAPTLVMVSNPTLQYVIYEWLRARLADRKAVTTKSTNRQKETTHEIFVTSALAKLGATLVTYPMLVVKSRLQAAQHGRDASDHYHGMIDAIRKIYLQEGFRGFYNGMKTKILQSVLAAALLFMVKEKLTIAVRKTLRTENAGL